MKKYPANKIRNITVMGHGGSGKTTLIEAMLFNGKAINRMGKTQDGNTVTDFDAEETRRGISINTSYAACEWKDHKFNLIDTPGDFDFLADQKLGMRVGDVILIVAGAKDGVSVGAEKTMRLGMKTGQSMAILINRVDEPNSSYQKTLDAFRDAYGAKIVPLTLPIMDGEKLTGVVDVVNKKAFELDDKGNAKEMDVPADMADALEEYHEAIQEQIAEADEELMMKYFDGEAFTKEEQEEGLRKAILTESIFPVFVGSAATNQGIAFTMDMIARYFPSPDMHAAVPAQKGGEDIELEFDPDGPLAAFVFKTIVDPFVGRISMFRVYSGKLTEDTELYNVQKQKNERITGLFFLRGKKQIEADEIVCGDIGALTKLSETQTNDTLSTEEDKITVKPVAIPEACLTLAISPEKKGEEDKIMQGLNRIADEDLSFTVENDPETHQLLLSGQGEVQLDVLRSKIKGINGVEANLTEPRVAYRETIRKKVEVQGRHKKQSGGHGQFGDVWIRFEPGEQEELEFNEEIFGGSVPKNFHPAVEKGLQEAVEHGVLAGYPVVNLKATLYDGSYHDVDSNEMSFKLAARLAYREGLPKADPILLEPIASVHVHIPDDYLGDIMGDMSKRRGRILGMGADSEDAGFQVVDAEAPMSELAKYATDLKSMTQGRGWFTIEFARYEPAPKEVSDKVIAAAQAEEE